MMEPWVVQYKGTMCPRSGMNFLDRLVLQFTAYWMASARQQKQQLCLLQVDLHRQRYMLPTA